MTMRKSGDALTIDFTGTSPENTVPAIRVILETMEELRTSPPTDAEVLTTVDRIVNAFPPTQHSQVRSMLSDSLRAVLCQYLIPRADGPGRVLAVEIMLSTEAIANLIRKGKTHQLPSMITTSGELGMQLMDVELKRLHDAGTISANDAYMRAASKKDFEALLESAPGSAPAGRVPAAAEAPIESPAGGAARSPAAARSN